MRLRSGSAHSEHSECVRVYIVAGFWCRGRAQAEADSMDRQQSFKRTSGKHHNQRTGFGETGTTSLKKIRCDLRVAGWYGELQIDRGREWKR